MKLALAGAIGGLGSGMVNQAAIMQKDEDAEKELTRRKGLELFLQDAREQMGIRTEARAEARELAREERTDQREVKKDERNWQNEQDRAPTKNRLKADARTSELGTELDFKEQNVDRANTIDAKTARSKATTDAGIVKEQGADEGYLNALSALTDAKGGTAAAIQAEVAQLGLDEKREVTGLIKEYASTQDPARKTQIKEALTVRGIIKSGEFDTEKVVTETQNPDGSTSKVERVQKRQTAGAPAAAATPPGPWQKYGKPPAAAPAATPAGTGMVATSAPPTAKFGSKASEMDRADIFRQEHRKVSEQLQAATDPDVRRRLEGDLSALQREAKGAGVQLSAPAPAATAPASPTAAVAPPPAAAPAAAPANPATSLIDNLKLGSSSSKSDPLMSALGAGGGGSIDQIVSERAPALREAAGAIAQAQAQVVTAAQSGDANAVTRASLAVSGANARLNALLKEMEPAQASKVRAAALQAAGAT